MQKPETKSASPRAVSLRHLQPEDTPQILSVVRSVDLDLNSAYAYAMFGEYFSATSLVAVTEDGALAGFVIGFVPPTSPDTVFVWQIGVDPAFRGAGVGSRLLDQLIVEAQPSAVEATVNPSNVASDRLFRAVARRHRATVRTEELFSASLFPAGHEAEIRYVIAPLSTEVLTDGHI